MDKAVEALINARTIAIVGLDNRQERPAYRVASYLKDQGYRIIPVPFHQQAEEVLGEKAYPGLREIPEKIDLVDVFVRSEQSDPVIDDAIAIGAGSLWLQLGIRNEAGLERARRAGLIASQDHCTKVEHARNAPVGQPGS